MKRKQTNVPEGQIDLMEDVDRYEQAAREREAARIKEKLRTEYANTYEQVGHRVDDLPDGLVVITEGTRYNGRRCEIHYYRAVVGHHRTVSGPMAHIISAPNREWPDVPPWMEDDTHKCQWIYPHGAMWTRKEPEYQPEIKWAEEGA